MANEMQPALVQSFQVSICPALYIFNSPGEPQNALHSHGKQAFAAKSNRLYFPAGLR
jgi:hypothetical protein